MKRKHFFSLVFATLLGGMVAHADTVATVDGAAYETLADALEAANGTSGAVVEVTADATLTSAVTLSSSMTIGSSSGATVTLNRNGGFVVSGGTVTVDGLAVTRSGEFGGISVFDVTGGSLVLTNGTSISSVYLKADCSAVNVAGGTLTMCDGTSISGCSPVGKTTAGTRAVNVTKGTFNFLGGSITGNASYSASNGAGVYVASGAALNVGGSATATGNTCDSEANDIYPASGSTLTVVSALTGSLGIYGATEGATFATAGTSALATSAASRFFDDAGTLAAAASGTSLVWSASSSSSSSSSGSSSQTSTSCVKVTQGSGTLYYDSLADAFAGATSSGATVTLLKDVQMSDSAAAVADVTLDGAGYTITRVDAQRIAVTNCALTVTNVTLSGGTARFIDVLGGTLTLDSGTTVANVLGDATSETVAAIVVWGGSFVMNGGVTIKDCYNYYDRPSGGPLAAGGVLVNGSSTAAATASVHAPAGNPSVITGCMGSSAGGLYIGNEATLTIGGAVSITDNISLSGEPLNLVVHDWSDTLIDEELTAGDLTIGFTEGIEANTNIVGEITASGLSDAQKLSTARAFEHDTNGDIGVAVTSGGRTYVVWNSCFGDGDTFTDTVTDSDGNVTTTTYTIVTIADEDLLTTDVPAVTTSFTYTGEAHTAVESGLGYVASGNVATNAGSYTVTLQLRSGYTWTDGSTADVTVAWTIAKATYDMSAVTFEDKTVVSNGLARSIYISGDLPTGVSVSYTGNGQTEVGTYTVTASFTGDSANYEAIADMTATLTITESTEDSDTGDTGDTEGDGDDSGDTGGGTTTETVECQAFAFTAIEQDDDGNWVLTLSPGTQYCTYTLYTSDDLVNWATVDGVETLTYSEADGGSFTFTVSSADAKRFWKVIGEDGVKSSE